MFSMLLRLNVAFLNGNHIITPPRSCYSSTVSGVNGLWKVLLEPSQSWSYLPGELLKSIILLLVLTNNFPDRKTRCALWRPNSRFRLRMGAGRSAVSIRLPVLAHPCNRRVCLLPGSNKWMEMKEKNKRQQKRTKVKQVKSRFQPSGQSRRRLSPPVAWSDKEYFYSPLGGMMVCCRVIIEYGEQIRSLGRCYLQFLCRKGSEPIFWEQ